MDELVIVETMRPEFGMLVTVTAPRRSPVEYAYDTTMTDLGNHRQAAMRAMLSFEGPNFELIGYVLIKPSFYQFVFKAIPAPRARRMASPGA